MPKSASARQRLCRKRKMEKLNDEEAIEFKKKEASRIKKLRDQEKSKMTQKEKQLHRAYERERKRVQRQKKRNLNATAGTPESGQTLDPEAFSSRQSKGKAISKAKRGLPIDPDKRAAVLEDVVREHSDQLTPLSKKKFHHAVLGQHSRVQSGVCKRASSLTHLQLPGKVFPRVNHI